MKKSRLFDIIAGATLLTAAFIMMIMNFVTLGRIGYYSYFPLNLLINFALVFCGVAALVGKRQLKMISWFVMAGLSFFAWIVDLTSLDSYYYGVSFRLIVTNVISPMLEFVIFGGLAALFLVFGIMYQKRKRIPFFLWLIPAALYLFELLLGWVSLIGVRYVSYSVWNFLVGQLMLVGIVATCFYGLYEAAQNGDDVPVIGAMARSDANRPQYRQPSYQQGFAQPQYGQQQGFAQPQYGQPQQGFAQPQYGQPQYGQPQQGFAQPQYGQPQQGFAQPQYAQPQQGFAQPAPGAIEEYNRAKELFDRGVISGAELEAVKRRLNI